MSLNTDDRSDQKWTGFAFEACRMMRVIREHGSEPLAPLIHLIETTDAIVDDELRIDLVNVIYEMGGNPGIYDATIRLLEMSRSEQHFVYMDRRTSEFAGKSCRIPKTLITVLRRVWR